MKVPGFGVILLGLAIGLFAVAGCEKKVIPLENRICFKSQKQSSAVVP